MYSLPGQELTPFGIMLGDHLPSLPNCKKFPRQKYLNYSLFKSLQAFQEAHQATDWTVEGILPSPTSEPPLVSARRVSLDIEDPCPDLGIYLIGPYLQVFSYSQHSNWSQISWWITRKERERERFGDYSFMCVWPMVSRSAKDKVPVSFPQTTWLACINNLANCAPLTH